MDGRAKITHGYLESNGWNQVTGNTFFKDDLKIWLWDKWTLETCPKSSSEKPDIIAKEIQYVDELQNALQRL